MPILSWLMHRAPDLETPPPSNRTPPNVRFTPLDEIVDDEDTAEDAPSEIALDELFCVIDYHAANGAMTRRRITLRKIARGPHAPILSAVCHERRAFRQFRCDRIECFIEPDGEAIDCAEFFRDQLHIDLTDLAPESAGRPAPTARDIRDHLRPAISILVTAANSDGEFHPEELDAICQYIEGELLLSPRCDRFRDAVTIELLDQLTTIVDRMRPQRASLAEHLSAVLNYAPEDRVRFAKALEHVIVADGVFHADEQEFLEEVADFSAARDRAALRMIAGIG